MEADPFTIKKRLFKLYSTEEQNASATLSHHLGQKYCVKDMQMPHLRSEFYLP